MATEDPNVKKGFVASYAYAGRHLEAKSRVLVMCHVRVLSIIKAEGQDGVHELPYLFCSCVCGCKHKAV